MNQYPSQYYVYYPAEYQVLQVQAVIGIAMAVAMGAWAFSVARKALKGEEVKFPL